ncbi:hypothetical protein AB6A40_005845 [Gnathostoma spinigerum]|uniref:G-protein coupled receptors family 2 profile 1 domain-containing protein n=1 Tax=Gnathostoma spinigerum TaxID=75299 RepID=A0ABD6ENY1_9BILA
MDYGSPQLFSVSNLTLIPVSISEVKQLSVNTANSRYQVFEWEKPEYGVAQRFVVEILLDNIKIYEKDIQAHQNTAFTKIPLDHGVVYCLIVSSVDSNGKTPSKPVKFMADENQLSCDGRCASGGRPACYRGQFSQIQQYKDLQGYRCICYEGYSGTMCKTIEKCNRETTVNSYGRIDWEPVNVNKTVSIPCPYGPEGEFASRICGWKKVPSGSTWLPYIDSGSCRKRNSIIIHLDVIERYARNARSLTGIETVHRFLESLLRLPALSANFSMVQFDTSVAESMIRVLGTVVSGNWTKMQGNTTVIKRKIAKTFIRTISILPVPYSARLSSNGISVETIRWLTDAATNDSFEISEYCWIHLPASDKSRIIRGVCIRNATAFENNNMTPVGPILLIMSDDTGGQDLPQYFTIGLHPPGNLPSYICVRFDKEEHQWTMDGVILSSRNRSGMVVCESRHFGLFSLLPVSLQTELFVLHSHRLTFAIDQPGKFLNH